MSYIDIFQDFGNVTYHARVGRVLSDSFNSDR